MRRNPRARAVALSALTLTVALSAVVGNSSIATAAVGDDLGRVPVDRISGQTRYDTAVEISRQVFPDYEDPDVDEPAAPVVYLASGTSFADALSAAPAAAHLGGPVLLTSPGALPATVAAELQRLDPFRVVIAGGPSAVSFAVEDSVTDLLPDTQVDRIGGADRYATSRAIASDAFFNADWQDLALDRPSDVVWWTSQDPSWSFRDERVYVATGSSFPDALSAGAAAGAHDAPLILLPGQDSSVDADTRQAIASFSPRYIYAAGGPAVITDGIINDLQSMVQGTPLNAMRIDGSDRFETARWIMNTGFTTGRGLAYGAASNRDSTVFVATGMNFPDALAGAAAAGYLRMPLVLTPGTCMSMELQHDVLYQQPQDLVLLGGEGIVASNAPARTC